jgi:hypothetical protein
VAANKNNALSNLQYSLLDNWHVNPFIGEEQAAGLLVVLIYPPHILQAVRP